MIFEPCPRCGGEGAIGWGHRWEDGEPLYWEPCSTCGMTGEVEVETELLDVDDDAYFEAGSLPAKEQK